MNELPPQAITLSAVRVCAGAHGRATNGSRLTTAARADGLDVADHASCQAFSIGTSESPVQ